jgi:hypothetical protein
MDMLEMIEVRSGMDSGRVGRHSRVMMPAFYLVRLKTGT